MFSRGDPSLSVVAERLKLAGMLGRRGLRRALRIAAEPLRPLAAVRAKAPQRLSIAPQDIRTVDPTIATEIYSGYFAFGGKIVNAGAASPFQLEAPSKSWARALGGFGWLKHLRAADTPLARANARALVEDFLRLRGRPNADDPMWEPRVVSRRILAFLSQSPMILEDAEPDFYRRFMVHFARARAVLLRALAEEAQGEWRLFAAIALAQLAVCSDADQRTQRAATQLLARELSRQLMADGGHIGRNPQTLVDLLLELLPLRQAYAARGTQMPAALLNAIDRMMPMLRLVRHGDGALALFNGMSVTQPELIATLLTYDDVRGRALLNAPYSGYQRVEARGSALIVDTGRPPPPAFSKDAHAGCLAFEFSFGGERVIVNCGAPGPNRAGAREIARTSAAHSTLIIDDTSSCRFSSSAGLDRFFEGQILSGPTRVEVARSNNADGERLALSHDGYGARFGCVHARMLTLAPDGARLSGEDSLLRMQQPGTAAAHRFALRFHLHPSVNAALVWDGQGVVLDLPSGERFTFDAGGREVRVEDSIFFAAPNGPRNSRQIVIDGRIEGDVTIGWTLARVVE
ncbi:MAG: heparinase II/III family protein [Methylobacteriaceae bacterium]|nr:heparinase II/III family protein [Methylobacteriaceae bacterium]